MTTTTPHDDSLDCPPARAPARRASSAPAAKQDREARRVKPTVYEYRLRYARAGWQHAKYRNFQTEQGVRRFVAKLRGDGRPYLGRLVWLEVDRRKVGAWHRATAIEGASW